MHPLVEFGINALLALIAGWAGGYAGSYVASRKATIDAERELHGDK